MTELRQKMIRTMDLKNLSKHTQRTYLHAVTGLAKHYHASPDTITDEMIEDYMLYLKNKKDRAPSGCRVVLLTRQIIVVIFVQLCYSPQHGKS